MLTRLRRAVRGHLRPVTCTGCGRNRVRYFWADRPEWPTCSVCGKPGGSGLSWLVDYGRDVKVSVRDLYRDRADRASRCDCGRPLGHPQGRVRHPARFLPVLPKER